MDLAKSDLWQMRAGELDAVERDDEDLAYLFLAQRSDDASHYLTLSRMVTSGKEVYLERDDQAWSCYGGIETLNLNRESMEIYLDENAAASLGGPHILRISFAPEVAARIREIEQVLRVILAEKSTKLIADAVR